MNFNFHPIIIASILSLLPLLPFAQNINSTHCNQHCGQTRVPYPFGFSDGCQIRLNCRDNSRNISISNFIVQNVTSDQILVNLPAKCDRPIAELSQLFSTNFAPTLRNGFLFENCSSPLNNCVIPNRLIRSLLALETCDLGAANNNPFNKSCYSDGFDNGSEFLNYENVTSRGNCGVLFSSVMVDLNENNGTASGSSSIWLDFHTVELRWWINGDCDCDRNAICTPVVHGGRGQGFRCHCNEGYAGDGFTAGEGCRRGLCGETRFHVPLCVQNHTRSIRKSVSNLLLKYILPPIISTIILVVIIIVLIRRRRRRRRRRRKHKKVPLPTDTSLVTVWRRISYQELVRGTSGFSETNLLGRGGFGSVFRGTLSDGLNVAIKIFNLQLEGASKSFDTESEILSSVRHRNLVRIISCCCNTEFKSLILSYMPNGSLEKWLYSESYCLDVLQRVNIALDVALALEYLHHGHTFPVVHCDIKPSNVLLDEDMTAHVADFGLSKLFDEGEVVIQTNTLATIGYTAPEYGSDGKVSTNGDVYSYGILLLEMFTGKRPTDDMFSGEMSLKDWVSEALLQENAVNEEVIAPGLLTRECRDFSAKEQCVSSVFGLAMECLAFSAEERINAIQIVAALQKIKTRFLASNKTRFLATNLSFNKEL